jgi:N-acetylglucosamine-6-phosphate deacetylase
VLTLEVGLANFLAAAGLTLEAGWPAASLTPAASLGLDAVVGKIETGYWADLVLLDEQLEVAATVVGGQVVYLREPARLQGAVRNPASN